MKSILHIAALETTKSIFLIVILCFAISCNAQLIAQKNNTKLKEVTAKDILGNPDYLAICYGGYRERTRNTQPTIAQIKQDLKILAALRVKIIRTYNVHLQHDPNVLEAIRQLKKENPEFEMYVMLGVWIDCKNAWTNIAPDHNNESDRNAIEVETAVQLANKYPEIVKIIAIGNEAMVRWATSYYVQPSVILKWVNHLQQLKKDNKLSKDLWVTSSDDFASWGGGDTSYRTKDLEDLIQAVDYVSMHTYPYHNSHYNPDFWQSSASEDNFTTLQKAEFALVRAQEFAQKQYNDVKSYVQSISPNKPIHIGETGWASISDGFYGNHGSKASDEYKQALYYKHMRVWTAKEKISCFFFEAFDEPWKDGKNEKGSENHFGLFTVEGKAKFALWDEVDLSVFDKLKRDDNSIVKTFSGNREVLIETVLAPPRK